MSDTPSGPDWWQASDDRWYPPETHPDYRPGSPQPTPGLASFAAPNIVDRYPTPHAPAPGGPGLGGTPGLGDTTQAGPGAPKGQQRSTTRVLVLIFGAVFLLMAGGCGLFVYNFRDEIADATIDFSAADPVPLDGSVAVGCDVRGTGFGENYGVDVTLTAPATAAGDDAAADNAAGEDATSHYQVAFELFGEDGELIGADSTVLRDMAAGEERTEDAFNTIVITDDVETVSCTVTELRRVPA